MRCGFPPPPARHRPRKDRYDDSRALRPTGLRHRDVDSPPHGAPDTQSSTSTIDRWSKARRAWSWLLNQRRHGEELEQVKHLTHPIQKSRTIHNQAGIREIG